MKHSWCTNVKQLLDNLGFCSMWQEQHTNTPLFVILQVLSDQFVQKWRSNMKENKKLELYSSIKVNFTREKYLGSVYINAWRTSITKMRCSAHSLEIETGRYYGIDRTQRKCKICQTQQIEDEYHHCLVCPKLRALRLELLPKYYCSWPSRSKMAALFNNLNSNVLGKFIYKCNIQRNKIMTN
jgi:hypothetical protein